MTSPLYPNLPENALVILIGASGAGKSTLANTWPTTQVLSLDALRGVISDDPGSHDATPDAADALAFILERRMARRLNFSELGLRSRISTERDALISAGQAWFCSG
ncbi:AAA family ATPase [Streptomyces sp. NPDC002889]|uniref:AAA family ATPase n=1 Tax=Streptomyces sp. NPDC002889 TaxID=3364669 RepID=UPI0036795E35